MSTPAADVAHLLRRTGFNSSTFRVGQLMPLDRPALVDAVLSTTGAPADTPPSTLNQYGVSQWQQNQDLANWWLNRMTTTSTPIVEKMTLFWHGHFVSSFDKVGNAFAMYGQNRLFRANALGSLGNLARAIAVQPAMLSYLDNDANVKGAPNQNFARELMELFLLGVGNYSEDDIIASARAWTGHGLNASRLYYFNPAEHDNGDKTFFGTTKNWNGPDIITEILNHPTKRVIAARFITRKLWTFFAYPQPADAIVNPLADALINSGFNIKVLLRALFLRDEFWSTAARQGLVRSPVEYVVNVLRQTHLSPGSVHPEWYLPAMGQSLLFPPTSRAGSPTATGSRPAQPRPAPTSPSEWPTCRATPER